MRSAPRIGIAALVAISLAGCAGPANQPTQVQAGSEIAEPAFSGPFADEYTEAWRSVDSEVVRAVIKDELITDQEWSQVLASLTTCLADKGITIDAYNDDGSYEADVANKGGESLNQIMGGCEDESGEAWIGYIYRAQTVNPDNVPEPELITGCLIRNGAVPPSYTVEKYLENAPGFEFPFLNEHGYETFEKCNADSSVVL
jgi:hypothetical protein